MLSSLDSSATFFVSLFSPPSQSSILLLKSYLLAQEGGMSTAADSVGSDVEPVSDSGRGDQRFACVKGGLYRNAPNERYLVSPLELFPVTVCNV